MSSFSHVTKTFFGRVLHFLVLARSLRISFYKNNSELNDMKHWKYY